MTTQAHGQNDRRFADFEKQVKDIARTHAKGDSALATLAAQCLKAAADGIISTTPNTHGKGVDDAKHLLDQYRKAYGEKAEDHYTNGGAKANASKLRQPIKVGEMTTIDPIVEFDRFIETYRSHAKADDKSVKNEFAAIVDFARTQLSPDNSDGPLTAEQLSACALKKPTEEPELEDKLEQVRAAIEKIITGDAGVKDQDPRVLQAHDLIRDRLAALVTEREKNEVMAKAAELGLNVSEDTPIVTMEDVEAIRESTLAA